MMPKNTAESPSSAESLVAQHRSAAESPVERAGRVVDYLVDALAGDPSCPLRRVQTLIDIAIHPGTSQTAIIERLQSDKSTIARDADWLYNYGCVTRRASESSGREVSLTICGFSQKHLSYAAALMGNDMIRLQKFVDRYISLFQGYRATLRDMKIITVMTAKGEATRAEIYDKLYNGPTSTDARTLAALIESGFLRSDDDEVL